MKGHIPLMHPCMQMLNCLLMAGWKGRGHLSKILARQVCLAVTASTTMIRPSSSNQNHMHTSNSRTEHPPKGPETEAFKSEEVTSGPHRVCGIAYQCHSPLAPSSLGVLIQLAGLPHEETMLNDCSRVCQLDQVLNLRRRNRCHLHTPLHQQRQDHWHAAV